MKKHTRQTAGELNQLGSELSRITLKVFEPRSPRGSTSESEQPGRFLAAR